MSLGRLRIGLSARILHEPPRELGFRGKTLQYLDIEIVPGSGLARLYGVLRRATVNSIHHQCVKTLGRGLRAEAVSPADGVIEAVRWSGSSYAVGLQWHPEFHRSGESRLLDGSPVLLEFLARAGMARGVE